MKVNYKGYSEIVKAIGIDYRSLKLYFCKCSKCDHINWYSMRLDARCSQCQEPVKEVMFFIQNENGLFGNVVLVLTEKGYSIQHGLKFEEYTHYRKTD